MQTPIRTPVLEADKARAARFGVYPICRAIRRIRWRVDSLIPFRPCKARSTVPIDTFANSAIWWIPLLSFFIQSAPHPRRRPAVILRYTIAAWQRIRFRVRCRCYTQALSNRTGIAPRGAKFMFRSLRVLYVTVLIVVPLVLLSVSVAQDAQPAAVPLYLDPSKPLDARVDDLIARMTLEEKASQVVNQARAIPRLQVPAYDWWSEALHGVANAGAATVFPEPIGLAATFDSPLIHAMAIVIGTEARAKHNQAVRAGRRDIMEGLDFWSPNINIFRDPRWGRGQETYGEDPFLTGRMGVAFVTGMQGEDPKYYRVIATPKHYAVHSGPEPTRHTANVDVSKHDEIDTYLPAFRAAVTEGHADSVMCAYNSINGEPACANEFLLQDQLRGWWNFQGYIVSDCGAVLDIHEGHKFNATQAESSAVSLRRGMDNECVDFTFKVKDDHDYKPYIDAVKQGYLAESDIDIAVTRLFTARMKLGMFDPPEMVPYSKIDESLLDSAQHRDMARKMADEAMVLLKNDGVLPLKASGLKI